MYEPLASFRPIAIPIARSISRALNETIGSAYNPLSLFAAGEQGVWYDPSDMSTLFQDAAGTIPVTTAGQPVGLMLDKSGRGNHATQPTATSRPILQFANGLWSLLFDGVDDRLVTGSIDFTATDKVTLWSGAYKATTDLGLIAELSPSAPGNNGTFYLGANIGGTNFRTLSKGTVLSTPAWAIQSPKLAVLTGVGDISGDVASLRGNGAVVASSAIDQGAGNYGNYPLYIGSRGGVIGFLNGNIYGLIVRGVKSTDAEITQTEAWMNSKTGAY